jgi:hypothetical protein
VTGHKPPSPILIAAGVAAVILIAVTLVGMTASLLLFGAHR